MFIIQVLITIFSNSDDYKNRLEKLLSIYPLNSEKYAISYCNN